MWLTSERKSSVLLSIDSILVSIEIRIVVAFIDGITQCSLLNSYSTGGERVFTVYNLTLEFIILCDETGK